MEPPLTIYIDEAGDPGVRDGLKYLGDRHEWLCVSAAVVRTEREADAVAWVKEMRGAANSTQPGALHYHRIAAARRDAVCAVLSQKPVRGFVMASHKSNMREYVNPRIQAMIDAGTFYNWCLRILLERVTAWCERWLKQEGIPLQPLHFCFARRGHDYGHFLKYVDKLRMQKETGTLYLKGPGLAPALLERSLWTVKKAEEVAGLQLADVAASAFYQAANTASPNWDLAPAKRLRSIIPETGGSAANTGVTVWPLHSQAPLPAQSRAIFEFYGYRF